MENSGRKTTWLFLRKANLQPAEPADTNGSRRGCSPSDFSLEFFDSLTFLEHALGCGKARRFDILLPCAPVGFLLY